MNKFIGLFLFIINIYAIDRISIQKQISTLEMGANMGNNKAIYNLGLLYSQDILLEQDQVFQKDVKKAKYYLNKALLNHYYQATYNLALIFIDEKKYFKAINIVDRTLKESDIEDKTRVVLTYLYTQIILTNFTDNEILVDKTKQYLENVLNINNPIFYYLYANILFLQKKETLATSYVDKACANSKNNKHLQRICTSYENNSTSITK